MESCTCPLCKEKCDRQGGGGGVVVVPCLLIRGDELWEKLGAPPRQRLPQMILFSCSLLLLHRFTSRGKAPHGEQDVIGRLLSTLRTGGVYPSFSCQEINMWHGISGDIIGWIPHATGGQWKWAATLKRRILSFIMFKNKKRKQRVEKTCRRLSHVTAPPQLHQHHLHLQTHSSSSNAAQQAKFRTDINAFRLLHQNITLRKGQLVHAVFKNDIAHSEFCKIEALAEYNPGAAPF
ncbi:hypothetical protein F7725_026261 [Dissostichus mawsoni]|uniref:Uncharacterized protein n=1 Tax=Dissostichus mawsoni TaxID=36200 RepID=A0A7J5X6I2_DISMA|nr:hypothetical protein F7725_026261 [Dissostichus mawsoni]